MGHLHSTADQLIAVPCGKAMPDRVSSLDDNWELDDDGWREEE